MKRASTAGVALADMMAILGSASGMSLTDLAGVLPGMDKIPDRTYRMEIDLAFIRLERAASDTPAPPWERITDTHAPGLTSHSLWSDTSHRYVAETLGRREDGAYLQLMDSAAGLLVAALLKSFIADDRELNQTDGHERCTVGACQIASVVAVARYLNREPT